MNTSAPRLSLTPLASVQPRPVRWLWDGRVPAGEVTLIAGPEGTGKSTLLAYVAAATSRGQIAGDLAGTPVGVVIAALEDDTARTLRPRLEAAGADLSRVSSVTMADPADWLQLPSNLAELVAAMRTRDARLLIVDPIKSAADVNPDREGEVRALLSPIVAAAHDAQVTVILAAHFRKGSANEDRAAWKIAGSAAWTQVPRSVLVFAEDPEADENDADARVLAHAKSNLGRLMPSLQARVQTAHVRSGDGEEITTSRLVLGGTTSVRAEEVGQRADNHGAGADARAFLAAYLDDGQEYERRDVLAAAAKEGIADRTLRRVARDLGVQIRREGSGKAHRSTWRLPTGVVTHDLCGPNGHSGITEATVATLAAHSEVPES